MTEPPGISQDVWWPCKVFSGWGSGGRTYESLEEVALEDVDDSLDGESELPVLGMVQLGPVLLQQQQGSLCIWATRGGAEVSRGYGRAEQSLLPVHSGPQWLMKTDLRHDGNFTGLNEQLLYCCNNPSVLHWLYVILNTLQCSLILNTAKYEDI